MVSAWLTEQNALVALCLVLVLTGCATTTGSNATDPTTLCKILQPITWSEEDSDDTIRGVKVNNAKWIELCGNKTR